MDKHQGWKNTGRAVAEEIYQTESDRQARQQESERRVEEAKQAKEYFDQYGIAPESETQVINTAYKIEIWTQLEGNKGKPIKPEEIEVKTAKEVFKVTRGQDFEKVRDAIRDNSPFVPRVPEHLRLEYANIATTKALQEYRKDIPREEKTRVQTRHDPNSRDLTEQEMLILKSRDYER